MKQVVAFLLLFCFGLQTFYKGIVLIDYKINTTAYIQQCENKARPEMECHGQCQMMKKIKQEEKKEQKNPERKLENKNEAFVLTDYLNIAAPCVVLCSQKLFCPNVLGTAIQQHYPVLRPPIMA